MALKGYGITFIDMDETLFRTFAKINVIKNGEKICSLSNKEYNSYVLKEGESYDFAEFSDAKLFRETSIPIPRTIEMLKDMIGKIKKNKSFSRIILLTAREDFKDKELFLETFTSQGIDVSDKNVFYIERAGNIKGIPVAQKKKIIVMKYLNSGLYTRCRMVDDDLANLRVFLSLEKELPNELVVKMQKNYNMHVAPIKFYALHIEDNGRLRKIKLEDYD